MHQYERRHEQLLHQKTQIETSCLFFLELILSTLVLLLSSKLALKCCMTNAESI